jgi:glycerate kinase
MKIVLAPDSFKESLTAAQVCQAMAQGIRQVSQQVEIKSIPMADGGDGTMDALVAATAGQVISVPVTDPLGNTVAANFGMLPDQQTAVIEMAQASGLDYVAFDQRTPESILRATTYGTGELIEAALDHGAKKLIIGLGGSATNDGGAGLAQALGVIFFDEQGQALKNKLGGGDLAAIASLSIKKLDPRLAKTEILLASDVTSPLVGPTGASFMFGRQKGADKITQQVLDDNLRHYAKVIEAALGKQVSSLPGSGAAGGLGAGLLAFTQAELVPGFTVIAEEVHLAEYIKQADLVLTGEGGTDGQTKFGKTPFGVAQLAKKANVPVISLAGNLGAGYQDLYSAGFTAFFSILPGPRSLTQALQAASDNVAQTTANIMRLWLAK